MDAKCHQQNIIERSLTEDDISVGTNYHQNQYTKHIKKYGIYHISFTSEPTLVDRSKCSKCDDPTEYECNMLGRGKFLCFEHAQRFLDKNSSFLPDFWFVVPILLDLLGERKKKKEVESRPT